MPEFGSAWTRRELPGIICIIRYESKEGVRVAVLLLEREVDVNAQDNDHDSPLHSASYNGEIEIARVLLAHDAEVSAKNDRSETPFHQVSQGEYESESDGVGIAQLLLDRGVDVNAQDKKHATLLHLASRCGSVGIVRVLLGHATVENAARPTPWHVTSEGRAADVNTPWNTLNENSWTPLRSASHNGNLKIARPLLDHGAKVDAVDEYGNTPLQDVSQGKCDFEEAAIGVAHLLLEHGGDINARRNDLWTPLHIASYNGNLEIARFLIDNGANVDVGWHPIALCITRANVTSRKPALALHVYYWSVVGT
ncbi:ankyrin repeat-containing domain protein [Lactarius vividus]|nr:ankyrin repeat-containing domain protein [Lactarius vividus]